MRRRLIIDTDAKNEADDQFAIVHALLSPSLDIAGIVPAHFGDARSRHSMQDSRDEVDLLLRLLDRDDVVVANGAEHAVPDALTPVDSDGARLIISEARKPGPLFVIFLGPLTDMASALLLDPSIADNPDLTVVWIGGTPYDEVTGGERRGEFNLSNDVTAANVVFQSRLRVWQIPMTVYRMVGVGYAELDEKVAPHGELGEYLVRQLKEFNAEHVDPEIEYRSLGDSPAVSVVLNPDGAVWRHRPVHVFGDDARMTNVIVEGRSVLVAESVDVRFLLEDMFAKIKAHAARR
ncbi:nucleoside hydrolase [Humibacter sp.]|uniref:nucleoside hydrolase n=1 Tax=Humibacter sp. TaxID=1940291 RepID=UPI003F7EB3EB